MCLASSSGETVCGSRQGTAGTRDGRDDDVVSTCAILITHTNRFALDDEFRIVERAHLRNVESFELGSGQEALSDDPVQDEIKDEAECENESDQGRNAHELRDELSRVAVEQPRDRASDAVPRAAVVTLTIREQPDRNHAPESVRAVDRNGSDRIVHL